jgi:hypothetical protein
MCCKSECIGVISGLNLDRDTATHFAQESLLKACCEIARKYSLPIVLHTSASSIERMIEIIRAVEGFSQPRLVHDVVTACQGDADKVTSHQHASISPHHSARMLRYASLCPRACTAQCQWPGCRTQTRQLGTERMTACALFRRTGCWCARTALGAPRRIWWTPT